MIKIINQPYNGQMGDILKNELANAKHKCFVIVSAFAKNSGVLRMKDAIIDFRNRGGKVSAFIGVDAHGTSYEAVLNLFSAVDDLYIIHDNNLSNSFHSKIYYFSDGYSEEWLSVGSNNFTGGGLWTNYETATLMTLDNMSTDDVVFAFAEFNRLINTFQSNNCPVSKKIHNLSELNDLLVTDYLRHEIDLQIDTAKIRHKGPAGNGNPATKLFGTIGKVPIPRVTGNNQGKTVTIPDKNRVISSIANITLSDDSEKMWFETRKMTGGSRNILDLSMLGGLEQGSGSGTRYETTDSSIVLGSVVFFDIDPTDPTIEKDITINYNAKDYVGCTIKIHSSGINPNGSWRIQLKGVNASGENLTNAGGAGWLTNKAIVLEKIKTDYYVMSVLPEIQISSLESNSFFVAVNGGKPGAKKYGLLDI